MAEYGKPVLYRSCPISTPPIRSQCFSPHFYVTRPTTFRRCTMSATPHLSPFSCATCVDDYIHILYVMAYHMGCTFCRGTIVSAAMRSVPSRYVPPFQYFIHIHFFFVTYLFPFQIFYNVHSRPLCCWHIIRISFLSFRNSCHITQKFSYEAQWHLPKFPPVTFRIHVFPNIRVQGYVTASCDQTSEMLHCAAHLHHSVHYVPYYFYHLSVAPHPFQYTSLHHNYHHIYVSSYPFIISYFPFIFSLGSLPIHIYVLFCARYS